MSQPIRVLHLEDSAADAELIQSELKQSQPQCEITWVQRESDYVNALESPRFDLILCDYNLQGFDGLAALKLAQKRQASVPVIMVTGTLDEDQAVECVKAGATDYVLKSRLQRLGPAVMRALREA